MANTVTEDGAALVATADIHGPEASGQARFWRLAHGALKLTIEPYAVSPAPDPHIFLSSRDDNVYEPGASLHLGLAPTDVAVYSRDLPELNDLETVRTLLIYCVEYDVFFGSGRVVPV